MHTMTNASLAVILALHGLWLRNAPGGKRAALVHVDCSDTDLSHVDLTNADLLGCRLTRANLRGSHLSGARLVGADLQYADCTEATFRAANLQDAMCSHAKFLAADMEMARLARTDLTHALFTDAHLQQATLVNANATLAVFQGANLRQTLCIRTNFTGASLLSTDFRGAYLCDGTFTAANVFGALCQEAVFEATTPWYTAQLYAMMQRVNMAGAMVRGLDLSEVPLVCDVHTKILACIVEYGGDDVRRQRHMPHSYVEWALHVAGEDGVFLAVEYGASLAAALILLRSCSWMHVVPDLCVAWDDALADIQAGAKREAYEKRRKCYGAPGRV